MKRALEGWLLLCLLAAPAAGDRVTLKDGRTFEGTARQADDKILVEMTYGTVSFPLSEVEKIERMPTASDQLEVMLSKIDRTDANALYQVGAWARENELPKKSGELLREALSLNPDHAGARKLLGYVKADGKWLHVSAALQLAQNKLEAGKHDELLSELLPALGEATTDQPQKFQVKVIEAYARLRAGQFEPAAKGFEGLSAKAPAGESPRYAAIAEILRAHPDGMYLLSEPYPPTAMLLGSGAPAAEPGPASLAKPAVLAGALRDKAKTQLDTGKKLVEEGKKLEASEPEAAKSKYALAGKSFDAADALVPGIARSHRVEVARRLIALITKDMNTEADKFDTLKAELGKRDLVPAAYAGLVQKMLRALTNVRADLEAILQLSAPFERELVLEVTDANVHLQKVNASREILNEELHGK
jgi:hypothetical protein